MDATETSTSERDHNKASARILRVLSAFIADTSGFGVTELSVQLGMTKNMVYRALTTLIEQGYLVRDPGNGRYQLGYRILELQNPNLLDPDFRALCASAMARISDLTEESVSLTVKARDYTVFIDGIEARKPGAYRTLIGALRSLHENSSGRAVLSTLPDADIEAYIARHRPMRYGAAETVLSPAELWRDIATTRKEGRLLLRQGDAPPMIALTFPIWGANGQAHGALSVGGPEERFSERLHALLPQIQATIDDLCGRTRLFSANASEAEIK